MDQSISEAIPENVEHEEYGQYDDQEYWDGQHPEDEVALQQTDFMNGLNSYLNNLNENLEKISNAIRRIDHYFFKINLTNKDVRSLQRKVHSLGELRQQVGNLHQAVYSEPNNFSLILDNIASSPDLTRVSGILNMVCSMIILYLIWL